MLFIDSIVSDKELERINKTRKSKEITKSVPISDCDAYLSDGWQVKRELKSRVIICRTKETEELLEDEVWLLFRKMSFEYLPPHITPTPTSQLQIDSSSKIKI